MSQNITLNDLSKHIEGGAVAIRGCAVLEPAGGPGDKVFPPLHSSTVGKSFTDASLRNAGPLFTVCPTGLVFGIWDSTGPKGGLGAKFARASRRRLSASEHSRA